MVDAAPCVCGCVWLCTGAKHVLDWRHLMVHWDGGACAVPTFDEGVSESDDEDVDRRPKKVFSRDLDEDDEMDDRAGVSRQGKGGRMVGAHLSTVNLYASPRSTRSSDPRSPHRGAGGPGAGPSASQDAPIMSSPPKNRRRRAPAGSGKADEGSDGGEGKFDAASGGGGKASDNEEEDDEDLEVARARMRAALKKKKKKKKKGACPNAQAWRLLLHTHACSHPLLFPRSPAPQARKPSRIVLRPSSTVAMRSRPLPQPHPPLPQTRTSLRRTGTTTKTRPAQQRERVRRRKHVGRRCVTRVCGPTRTLRMRTGTTTMTTMKMGQVALRLSRHANAWILASRLMRYVRVAAVSRRVLFVTGCALVRRTSSMRIGMRRMSSHHIAS